MLIPVRIQWDPQKTPFLKRQGRKIDPQKSATIRKVPQGPAQASPTAHRVPATP
jgi:hypothetical protein